MPLSVTAADEGVREDFPCAFVPTYLREGVRTEGHVRDLGAFSRCLDVASLARRPNDERLGAGS